MIAQDISVILLKEIKGLGRQGEIKNVSPGYAFNFLLPRRLAVLASAAEKEKIKNKAQKKARELALRSEKTSEIIKKLQNSLIVIQSRASENGRLFAGQGTAEISREIARQKKINIKPGQIVLEKKLKSVGEYPLYLNFGSLGSALIRVRLQAAP